jgi:sodium/potassium-transporting ATPase subunit alpha
LSPEDQTNARSIGQSAYFMGLFFLQCFNLFICKARLGLPWGSFMFQNKKMFVSVLIGFAVVVIFVYVPPINGGLGTYYKLSPLVWLIPIGTGFLLWVYAIIRTIVRRHWSPVKYSEDVYGLQMYPTRWSTTGAK